MEFGEHFATKSATYDIYHVVCTVSVSLPGSTSYIQHPPHPLLSQQRHNPALVLLRSTLRVSDVHLPHFGCFAVGILVRKTLGCHAKRAGSEDAVDRHTAACTCQSGVSEQPAIN